MFRGPDQSTLQYIPSHKIIPDIFAGISASTNALIAKERKMPQAGYTYQRSEDIAEEVGVDVRYWQQLTFGIR